MASCGDDVLRAQALPDARRWDLLRLPWSSRNNVGNSVGAEIYERIGPEGLEVTYEVFESP
jgi:hypothetical protein